MTKTRNDKEEKLKKGSAEEAAEEKEPQDPCDEAEDKTEEDKASDESAETADSDSEGDAGQDEKQAEEAAQEEPIKDQYLRLMADFQNYKRRVEKEKEETRAFANERIITDLLTVLDNFDRAMEHDADAGFKEGMQMILDQFNTVLKHAGVEEIEAEKAVFDPNLHNAVMMEDSEDVESGHVSCVLQKGYKLNGRVIRPAMVKVAN